MHAAIRKAALLVRALDPAGAEAVLAQLDAATAEKIRKAARTLGAVDAQEQHTVLEEFFAQEDRGRALPAGAASPAERLAASGTDEIVLRHGAAAPPARRPFQFLETIDAERLAARLRSEHPQTIALVAAHAPRALAAELLWRLPESLRTDVLVRVIDWQGTDPQLLEELERALEVSLAAAPPLAPGVVGLEAAREILQMASDQDRGELLAGLARRDAPKAALLRSAFEEARAAAPPEPTTERMPPALDAEADEAWRLSARRLSEEEASPPAADDPTDRPAPDQEARQAAPPPIAFAELSRLDDRALLRVFAAADPQAALLALTGARPALVERLLRRLPRREASQLRRRMETQGPFRLRDVEWAQDELARVAARLAAERKIRLPARRRAA